MSGKFKSNPVVGEKFGEWEVASDQYTIRNNRAYWWCRCSCGKTKFVEASTLTKGRSLSCGCKRNVIHGGAANNGPSIKIYSVWYEMKRRCLNPKSSNYHNYGGRGITVCDRWMKFENFLEDMGPRPEDTSLDRINNSLGYFPANCRWATIEEQSLNKRTNVRLTFNGESLTIKEWSDKLGIPYTTIAKRIVSGANIEEVLSIDKLSNRETDYADRLIMYKRKTRTVREWVDILGLNYNTVKSRLSRGVTDPDAIFSSLKNKTGPKTGSKKPEGSGRGFSAKAGDKFGSLTIKSIFREPCGKQTITKALCICDCGKEKKVSFSNLSSGKTKSCGCLKSNPSKEKGNLQLIAEKA